MDPDATIRELVAAVEYGDADGIQEACENLAEWLRKGGFPPAADSIRRAIAGTHLPA